MNRDPYRNVVAIRGGEFHLNDLRESHSLVIDSMVNEFMPEAEELFELFIKYDLANQRIIPKIIYGAFNYGFGS